MSLDECPAAGVPAKLLFLDTEGDAVLSRVQTRKGGSICRALLSALFLSDQPSRQEAQAFEAAYDRLKADQDASLVALKNDETGEYIVLYQNLYDFPFGGHEEDEEEGSLLSFHAENLRLVSRADIAALRPVLLRVGVHLPP